RVGSATSEAMLSAGLVATSPLGSDPFLTCQSRYSPQNQRCGGGVHGAPRSCHGIFDSGGRTPTVLPSGPTTVPSGRRTSPLAHGFAHGFPAGPNPGPRPPGAGPHGSVAGGQVIVATPGGQLAGARGRSPEVWTTGAVSDGQGGASRKNGLPPAGRTSRVCWAAAGPAVIRQSSVP